MKKQLNEVARMQQLAGILKENNPSENWDDEVKILLDLFAGGNENEYQPGQQMDDNFEIELGEGNDLENLYQYLKTLPNQKLNYIFKKKLPVTLTADSTFEDDNFGNINLKYKEPETWDNITY